MNFYLNILFVAFIATTFVYNVTSFTTELREEIEMKINGKTMSLMIISLMCFKVSNLLKDLPFTIIK